MTMEITGMIGKIAYWAVLFTAYSGLLIGLICILFYVFDFGFTYIMKGSRAIGYICQYVAYRKEFHKWRKSHLNDECEKDPVKEAALAFVKWCFDNKYSLKDEVDIYQEQMNLLLIHFGISTGHF